MDMKDATPPGLRERARRAIQWEIMEAAQHLFVERGYDHTTIDDIAKAVGTSRRSVFRYFATKEDIVIGKFELFMEPLPQHLRERPLDEPLWHSLRGIADLLVTYVDDPDHEELADPMHRIIFTTPSLLASYLETLERLKLTLADVVRERAASRGEPYADHDPAPTAIVGAALGCIVAAQRAWIAQDAAVPLAPLLDRAMSAIHPLA